MTTNPTLERLRNLTVRGEEPKGEETEYTAFAFGRIGSRTQLALAIRKVSGSSHGFTYAHLYSLDHEPSLGIILRFSQHRVVIQGRNLGDLYLYLMRQRVDVIQVIDPLQADTLGEDVSVVTSVEIVAIRDPFGELS